MIILTRIGDINNKGKHIIVSRDQYGKFYVNVDSVPTQKKLNATEIVRYLMNALEDGTSE